MCTAIKVSNFKKNNEIQKHYNILRYQNFKDLNVKFLDPCGGWAMPLEPERPARPPTQNIIHI